MGRVWRAVDEILDRLVAVKEIRIDGSDAEDIRTRRERTLREGRATARIDHPNVVRVYDVVDEGERLWIVMELVPGRSLERIMAEEGPLGPRETARIGLCLVAALRQVHARGVLHRDIKPGNVLVEAGAAGAGRVVLTDFGIAAIQDATALTMVGMLVGSPDYMAPERISGRRQGPPSDLWSLGATLCAALAGHSPFSRDTTLATLHAVLYEEPELPPSPGPLRALLAALLTKDPSTRPTLTTLETTLHLIADPPPPPTLPAAPRSPETAEDEADGGRTRDPASAGPVSAESAGPGSTGEGGIGPPPAERPAGAAGDPDSPDGSAGPVYRAGVSTDERGGAPVRPGPPVADIGTPVVLTAEPTATGGRLGDGGRVEPAGAARTRHAGSGAEGPPTEPAGPPAGRGAPDGPDTERRPEVPFDVAVPGGGPRHRRTALLAALGVVAVGVVVAVLLTASGGGGRRGAAHGATGAAASRGGSSSAASQAGADASTASSSATPTGSSGGAPATGGTATPSDAPPGTGTPSGAPPGGRVEAGGFAWVPPHGWRRDVKTGAEVHYTSPDGRQELVAKSSLARGDLWETWQQSERDARQGRDYVRVRLARTSFQGHPAVVWEYTFTLKGTPWHARLLGFDADGKSYQVNTWYQPEIEIGAVQTYSTVKETFTVL
ncbi:protein kinase domain-containing protein [Streptomyces collinus]|uniref:serine/threonine-protein kinase n=1 Tax=Streptomyces collinus TaxID=42684 RepID=UPI00397FDA5B